MDLSAWRSWWRRTGEGELRALLLGTWDPIGISDEPLAASEYDTYLAPLARRLREGASADEIADYLTSVRPY
jgi:hypothetical protein